jgi:hypothetical protein
MAAIGVTQQDGVLNCKFSVNEDRLQTIIRPMVVAMLQEIKLEERLTCLDDEARNLRRSVEGKADVRSIKDLVNSQEDNARHIQQKADQRLLNDVKSAVAIIEKVLASKSDQTALDELGSSVQRVAQTVGQKADLSYVNKTNSAVQRLTQTTSLQERQIAGLTAARDAMEKEHIPQNLMRTKDMLAKTSNSLKHLQDVVATKAERTEVEEVTSLLKDLDCSVGWKASQQSVVDLSTSIHDLEQQLCLKADLLGLEEARADLQRTRQQVALKTDQQQVHELSVSLQAMNRLIGQKLDSSCMNEAKSRLQQLEAATQNKASHQDVGDLTVEVSKLREALFSQKIESQRFSALEDTVEQLNARMLQRADVEAVAVTENALEELRQDNSKKAEAETVMQQFQEMGKRLEFIVAQLQLKVDKAFFDESLLPLQAWAGEHLSLPSMASASTLSAVTTNSSRSLVGAYSVPTSKVKSATVVRTMSPRVGRQASQKSAVKT